MDTRLESQLLGDLLQLLKQYGPECFDRLAAQLATPKNEFVTRLAGLLTNVTCAAEVVPRPGVAPETRPFTQKELRAALVEMTTREPEKGVLLLRLYDRLMAKILLPSTQELCQFASRLGLASCVGHSRPAVVLALFDHLRGRSLTEITTLVAELNVTVESKNAG